MKSAIIPLALLSTLLHGASNLSITPAGDGSDYLWVSCLDDSDTGFIWRFNGSVSETWRAFPERYHGVSTTITLDPFLGMHLIAAVDNVLYSLDPWEAMATEDSLVFPQDYEWSIPGLLRRTAVPGWGLLSRYMATYFSSGQDFMWITREYTVSETGQIACGDSLMLHDPYPLLSSRYPEDLVHNVTFPVMNYSGCPVTAQRQLVSGDMPPDPANWRIAAQCHNTTASSVYLTADTLTCSTTDSTEPELLASGSDYYQALFLWSDSTGTVYYSVHDCMEGFASTSPFPGQGPSRLQAAAMSANPADPGLLLVWQSGDDLYCRHYSDGWNDYAHLIRSGLYPLSPGALAVCSVEDGYWVGYREASQPDVFFVDRNDVTGIGSSSSPVEPVHPSVWPNPFSSSLSVGLSGEAPVEVDLFDGSGRLFAHDSGEGTVLMDTSDLPCGCYLVRITSGDAVFMEKAVLAR